MGTLLDRVAFQTRYVVCQKPSSYVLEVVEDGVMMGGDDKS